MIVLAAIIAVLHAGYAILLGTLMLLSWSHEAKITARMVVQASAVGFIWPASIAYMMWQDGSQ